MAINTTRMKLCQHSEKYGTAKKKTEKTDMVLREEITDSFAQMREEHPILQV